MTTHPTPPERELVALLACPFCGGEANVIGKDGPYHGRAVVCIAGGGCTASLGEKYDRDGCDDHYFTSKLEAITAWNTRAATVPQEVWLPIESAPKDGTAVLGYWGSSLGAHRYVTGRNYGITAFCQTTGEWYDASESDNEDDVWGKPNHWQPLPTPPPAELGKDPT